MITSEDSKLRIFDGVDIVKKFKGKSAVNILVPLSGLYLDLHPFQQCYLSISLHYLFACNHKITIQYEEILFISYYTYIASWLDFYLLIHVIYSNLCLLKKISHDRSLPVLFVSIFEQVI